MKEKLKALISHFSVALSGGFLAVLAGMIWRQYVAGSAVGPILLTLTYSLVFFLLANDGFYRLLKGNFKRALFWSVLTVFAFWIESILAYILGYLVLSAGSYISLIIFAVVAVLDTVAVFVFALVMTLRPLKVSERWVVSSLALVCLAATVLPLVLAPTAYLEGFRKMNVQYGQISEEIFSATDTFSLDDGFILPKDPNKDFVVLNLTDIQLTDSDFSPFTPVAKVTFAGITQLVERTNPSLITISGDVGCGYERSTRAISAFLNSFGIPWAPVFGNHDHEVHGIDANKAAEIYMSYSNCLFKKGPANMGVGNYMIHVMEGTDLLHTFFMMDSHDHATFTVDGKKVTDYDHFWNGNNQQFDWYRWGVEGIAAYQNKTVPSTVIAHIPVVQFEDAFNNAWDFEEMPKYKKCTDYKNGCFKDDTAFGVYLDSGVCSSPVDNGFFALMKALGSTEHFVAGHDHTNSFSVMYEGIRLTYGLKTGAGCYWNKNLNGGTTLTLSSEGHITVAHEYITD